VPRGETEPERATTLIPRDKLLDLVDQSNEPELLSLAHTVSRHELRARGSARDLAPMLDAEAVLEDDTEAVSPLAILFVLCLFVALFVALIRLG
jgi:hypothetical protein